MEKIKPFFKSKLHKRIPLPHFRFRYVAFGAAAAAIVVGLFLGSRLFHTPSAEQPQSADEVFDAFCDSLFTTQLSANTLNLHYTLAYPEDAGISEYPITLGDYTMDAMQEGMAAVETCIATLEEMDYDALSSDRQLTYDCMITSLRTEYLAADVLAYTEILGPTTGFQAQLPILLAEYTFYDTQDVDDYLALLAEVPSYFSQILDFEREKADAGLFMPFYAVEDIIEQCVSLISDTENHFLVTTFSERLAALGLSETETERYIAQNAAVLNDAFFPAYETLIAGLRDLENAGTNLYGLCYFEDGRTYYSYLAAANTGSSRSVEEMYEMVLSHLDESVAAQYMLLLSDPEVLTEAANALQEMAGNMAEDDTMDGDTADGDLSDGAAAAASVNPNTYIEDLREKCTADFPTLSGISYTLRSVDASLEDYLSPAFYLTPTLDAEAKNVIYINYGHSYSALSLYTTLAHEGFPGHLYQNAYTVSVGLPQVRALFGTSGYAEGWATYAEQFAYSYADIDEAVAELYRLNAQISLALCAALDIGIHYYYWTPDDAAAFLEDYGIVEEAAVTDIYEYIVEEPASYLDYEIGYLEFMNLRSIAQEALGDAFDLREFHETLLTIGEAPFSVVEAYMRVTLGL